MPTKLQNKTELEALRYTARGLTNQMAVIRTNSDGVVYGRLRKWLVRVIARYTEQLKCLDDEHANRDARLEELRLKRADVLRRVAVLRSGGRLEHIAKLQEQMLALEAQLVDMPRCAHQDTVCPTGGESQTHCPECPIFLETAGGE